MGKPRGTKTKPKSVATGRKRRLYFLVCGERFTINTNERVEMVDLATGERLDPARWHGGNGTVRTPLGCTPNYFELRVGTGERIRDYRGFVRAEPR